MNGLTRLLLCTVTFVGLAGGVYANALDHVPGRVVAALSNSEEKYDKSFHPPQIKGERIVFEASRNFSNYRYQDTKSGVYVQVLGYKASYLPGSKTFLWTELEIGNQGKMSVTIDPVHAKNNLYVQIPWKELPTSLYPKTRMQSNVASLVSWVNGCKAFGVKVTDHAITLAPGHTATLTWGNVLNAAVSSNTLKSSNVKVRLDLMVKGASSTITGSLF